MSYTPLRVLVTAVGGDLGQAVVKSLRLSKEPIEIYGCDVDIESLGKAFVDSYHLVPLASEKIEYRQTLNQLCQSFEIQAVLPASEPELNELSQYPLPCDVPLVCQKAGWIDLYGDKLNCFRALEGKVELASFVDGGNIEAVNDLVSQTSFPVVIKSRRSSGSQSLCIAHNHKELKTYLAKTPLPLVQEYIEDWEGEYSIGIFATDKFKTAIAFRRKLGPKGCSWFAETSYDSDILNYALDIARFTRLRGSANVQVRKTKSGVRLLEINPRFSSLAAARAICGFKDVEWSVRMLLGMEIETPVSKYKYIQFRRFLHELVSFGEGFQAILEWCPK